MLTSLILSPGFWLLSMHNWICEFSCSFLLQWENIVASFGLLVLCDLRGWVFYTFSQFPASSHVYLDILGLIFANFFAVGSNTLRLFCRWECYCSWFASFPNQLSYWMMLSKSFFCAFFKLASLKTSMLFWSSNNSGVTSSLVILTAWLKCVSADELQMHFQVTSSGMCYSRLYRAFACVRVFFFTPSVLCVFYTFL